MYCYPPRNRGPKTTFFRRLHNLQANLTAYIFATKHDINKQEVRWQLKGVSYIVSKRHELWSTKGLKLDLHFDPPYVNSAFYFIARLHRRKSISKQNLTKLC